MWSILRIPHLTVHLLVLTPSWSGMVTTIIMRDHRHMKMRPTEFLTWHQGLHLTMTSLLYQAQSSRSPPLHFWLIWFINVQTMRAQEIMSYQEMIQITMEDSKMDWFRVEQLLKLQVNDNNSVLVSWCHLLHCLLCLKLWNFRNIDILTWLLVLLQISFHLHFPGQLAAYEYAIYLEKRFGKKVSDGKCHRTLLLSLFAFFSLAHAFNVFTGLRIFFYSDQCAIMFMRPEMHNAYVRSMLAMSCISLQNSTACIETIKERGEPLSIMWKVCILTKSFFYVPLQFFLMVLYIYVFCISSCLQVTSMENCALMTKAWLWYLRISKELTMSVLEM